MRAAGDGAADRGFPRRFAFALALAVVLHALAALIPAPQAREPREQITVARVVTIARRTPPPSPAPTPRPTPQPTPAPHASLAPRIAVRAPAPRAAAVPRRRSGGAAAPRRVLRPASPQPAPPPSLADATHAGAQNGGVGNGAGAGAGDGGQSGAGTGDAGNGTGNAGTANAAPCGDIYLLPGDLAYRKDGTVVQHVIVKIVSRDGSVALERFPYPFLYPAEKLNPFRHDDAVTAADGGIPVQEPPPGDDPSTFPTAVQIVLKYTNPKTGYTSLPACTPPSALP